MSYLPSIPNNFRSFKTLLLAHPTSASASFARAKPKGKVLSSHHSLPVKVIVTLVINFSDRQKKLVSAILASQGRTIANLVLSLIVSMLPKKFIEKNKYRLIETHQVLGLASSRYFQQRCNQIRVVTKKITMKKLIELKERTIK